MKIRYWRHFYKHPHTLLRTHPPPHPLPNTSHPALTLTSLHSSPPPAVAFSHLALLPLPAKQPRMASTCKGGAASWLEEPRELQQRHVEMGVGGAPAATPPSPKAANRRRQAPAGFSRGRSGRGRSTSMELQPRQGGACCPAPQQQRRGRTRAPAPVAARGAPCAGALLLNHPVCRVRLPPTVSNASGTRGFSTQSLK